MHDIDTDKELPPEPPSANTALSPESEPASTDLEDNEEDEEEDEDEEAAIIEMAVPMRIVDESSLANQMPAQPPQPTAIPPRRQSLLFSQSIPSTAGEDRPSPKKPEMTYRKPLATSSGLIDPDFMPAPLALIGRSLSAQPSSPAFEMPPRIPEGDGYVNEELEEMQLRRRSRDTASPETTSWLDTIDESTGSAGSSLHSRRSSVGIHRKRIRRPTRATEVELSAAMDAAVEAAYGDAFDVAEEDEGYHDDQVAETERAQTRQMTHKESDPEALAQARRTFERQRQLSQQAERDNFIQEHQRLKEEAQLDYALKREDLDRLEADEAEEEERLLDEMTKGYSMADFQFDPSAKSALPSKSDSSVFSGLTWNSSHSSRTAATGSSIAALAESIQATTYPRAPAHPPPATALPLVPPPLPTPASETAADPVASAGSELPPPRPSSFASPVGPGVRERRFSGQNAKQLKIETASPISPSKKGLQNPLPILPVQEEATPPANGPPPKSLPPQRPPIPVITQQPPSLPVSAQPLPSSQSDAPVTPILTKPPVPEAVEVTPPSPQRPVSRPRVLRKNISSSSLKKLRNLSVQTADGSDVSPLTPASATFSAGADSRRGMSGTTPVMPTPGVDDFAIDGMNAGGLYLFDDAVCSPVASPCPNSPSSTAPLPLESCPEAFLLRPFWLMRCLYQTMAHPRGGYISTRLFVPRDVWRVKNVKIKNVEDKVAQCEVLTTALLSLAKVDNCDADAVLDEMQRLESVIEQVRTTLQKKLGSEVGVPGSAALFKASPATDEANNNVETQLAKSNTNKSYLSSWKKLRSKSSGAGLTNSFQASKEASKDTLSMSSLPMTPTPTSRPPKRNIAQLQLTGPNANYMGALARLCDAVQVLGKQLFVIKLTYNTNNFQIKSAVKWRIPV